METVDDRLSAEIDKVIRLWSSSYRKGIIAGLRDYRAMLSGQYTRPRTPPAHYKPKSKSTWQEGWDVGWARGEAIKNGTWPPAINQQAGGRDITGVIETGGSGVETSLESGFGALRAPRSVPTAPDPTTNSHRREP